MIKIYLTNLAAYNDGELKGEWIELPLSREDLHEAMDRVLGNDEELFITDYEAPFEISEYEDIEDLNDFVDELENEVGNLDDEIISAIFDNVHGERDDALNALQDGDYTIIDKGESLKSMEYLIGEYNIHELGMLDIPDELENYFDYEAYGRDLSIDGMFIETDNYIIELRS